LHERIGMHSQTKGQKVSCEARAFDAGSSSVSV